MRAVAEREGLWCAGAGIVELPGGASAKRETLLRDLTEDALGDALADRPLQTIATLAASDAVRPALLRSVFDLRRGSWQVLCPIAPESIVVDLDAGFGAVSRSLARRAGLVVAVDDVRARLVVADALNRAQGVENVRLACGDVRALEQWPDTFVDGVALGGRLAAIGGADRAGEAERVAFLRQVRRVLSDRGWVTLTAENGRELRTMVARRSSPYPGVAGLTGMLHEAGFADVSAFAVAPDHEHGHTLVPLTSGGDLRSALHAFGVRKKWKLALLGHRVLRPFVPRDVLVVARVPGAPSPEWLERNGEPLPLQKIYLNSGRASLWYRRRRAGSDRIREVALDDASEESVRRMAAIATAWHGKDDAPAFFDGWRSNDAGGRLWTDRRNVPGRPLMSLPDREAEDRLRAVCRALRSLAAIGDAVRLPRLDRVQVLHHFLRANANARDRQEERFVARIERVATALRDRYAGASTLLMHGDLTPNNVLVNGQRVELIDWDLATPVDFPGYDVMNLLWYRHCGPDPEAGFWTHVVEECAAGRADADAARWIREAYGNVDPVGTLATFWLLRLARGTAFGDAWVKRHAIPSLERAESWLTLDA